MGEVSNPWPPVELSCFGTGINPEMGTDIEGTVGDVVYASVAIVVVGTSSSTTGTLLSREILKSTRLFQ